MQRYLYISSSSHHRPPQIFFFNFIYLFIYFIYGCVGSSFLCEGFLQLWQVGATPHCSAQASHCRGLSCCGAQAPDAQAQQLWLTGLVAPRHVGSSQTRARTRVPRIGRQILNHCATREAPPPIDFASGFFVLELVSIVQNAKQKKFSSKRNQRKTSEILETSKSQ